MERKRAARTWMPALLGLAAYTLLTLAYLRPVWRVGGDHLAPAAGDPVFNLWVLSWGAHQVREGLPGFWDANIFWPDRGTLALSDHLFGPAVQLAAFQALVPNPIAGYNALFFTSFVASAFATAWVLRRAGRSWTAALLAGWMLAFSPFRLMHLNHIQILIIQWLPLTLWFWDRLLAERTAKAASLFLAFYLLHVSGGCYLAYMIHVPMAALLAVRLREHGRDLLAPRSLRVLLPTGLVAAADRTGRRAVLPPGERAVSRLPAHPPRPGRRHGLVEGRGTAATSRRPIGKSSAGCAWSPTGRVSGCCAGWVSPTS